MHLPHLTISIGLLFSLLTSAPVRAASPRQIKWQELSALTGRNVSLVMPGGALISGKVVGVDDDALRVNVARTAGPGAHLKGEVQVPRGSLRVLEVQARGHKFRVIGTVIGAAAGFAGGVGAAIAIQGGIFGHENPGAANATLIGITAGGAFAGYLAGNRADRRSTTYEILP